MRKRKQQAKKRGSAAREEQESAKLTGKASPVVARNATATASVSPPTEKSMPPRWISVYLPILAIIISLIGSGNSIYQTIQTRKVLRAHVRPDVKVVVRHNSQQNVDKFLAAELVVWNAGPIKAVSVCASYRVYLVTTNDFQVVASMGIAEDLTSSSIIQPELNVGQRIGRPILGAGELAIYVVKTDFYRESDMERFSREDFFFCEAGAFYSYEDFKSRKEFQTILKSLQAKRQAEAMRPNAPSFQMAPAQSGAANIFMNFASLDKNGLWTNLAGTKPVTLTPLFPMPGVSNAVGSPSP